MAIAGQRRKTIYETPRKRPRKKRQVSRFGVRSLIKFFEDGLRSGATRSSTHTRGAAKEHRSKVLGLMWRRQRVGWAFLHKKPLPRRKRRR
jgi:hypothetical protein